MPQAWQAKLTPKELKVFETLYEDALIEDGLHRAMFRLMMTSKAPGTVINHIFLMYFCLVSLVIFYFNQNKLKRLTNRDKF